MQILVWHMNTIFPYYSFINLHKNTKKYEDLHLTIILWHNIEQFC